MLPCSIQQAFAAGRIHIRLERGQRILFLDLPVQLAGGNALQRVHQCGQQDVVACDRGALRRQQAVIVRQFRVILQGLLQVLAADTPCLVVVTEPGFREVATGTGDAVCGGQCLREGQVLVAVQGIVMHEVPDGGLCRQHVFEVRDQPLQQLANVCACGRFSHRINLPVCR